MSPCPRRIWLPADHRTPNAGNEPDGENHPGSWILRSRRRTRVFDPLGIPRTRAFDPLGILRTRVFDPLGIPGGVCEIVLPFSPLGIHQAAQSSHRGVRPPAPAPPLSTPRSGPNCPGVAPRTGRVGRGRRSDRAVVHRIERAGPGAIPTSATIPRAASPRYRRCPFLSLLAVLGVPRAGSFHAGDVPWIRREKSPDRDRPSGPGRWEAQEREQLPELSGLSGLSELPELSGLSELPESSGSTELPELPESSGSWGSPETSGQTSPECSPFCARSVGLKNRGVLFAGGVAPSVEPGLDCLRPQDL